MRTFVTSDQHFGHRNIITYCNRPFASVEEMNETMLERWNKTVGPEDIIYFLGDLTLNSRGTEYWLDRLNGDIIFVRGNHDRKRRWMHDSVTYQSGDVTALLLHNPSRVPPTWTDWVVHGHVHNNRPERYPFINYHRKSINVSVEMTGYKPLDLDMLLGYAARSARRSP